MNSSFKNIDSKDLPLVMVAEGNADEMCLISDVLVEKDFRVLGYSDCEKAYDLLKRETPALVIIDISLAGNRGAELINKIRSEESLGALPLIAIVASDMEKDLAGGGADAFLLRPFDGEALKKTVECLFKEK